MDFRTKNLKEIKAYIKKNVSMEDYPPLIETLKKDHRKSVYQLGVNLQKKYGIYRGELLRLEKMREYEKTAYQHGYSFVAGIDEVGRGPLAGPVVSAAVILPKDFLILHINDSKKLSPKKREELYIKIKDHALDIGIGVVDAPIIDRVNIYQATKMSIVLAVNNLQIKPDILFLDAMKCEDLPIPQWTIIKGDTKSISIAAASIIAKVTRDKMMEDYHNSYPHYCFNKNKGYGTHEHRMAINEHGIISIHRKSFLKNIINK